MRLTFLGTRGEIAVKTRRHARHSSLLVAHRGKRVMVDCGADWLRAMHKIRPDTIFLTHAHPDHAYGLRAGAPCPVVATETCWHSIDRFPVQQRAVAEIGHPVSIGGLIFQPFEVEHSLLAPAVGYRITAGNVSIFYAPDLVYIIQRAEALRGTRLYIGDGATLTRSLVRRRGERLIGHAAVSTQLTWCHKEGVPRALISHCGTAIVSAPHAIMSARIRELGSTRGVVAELACDGRQLSLR